MAHDNYILDASGVHDNDRAVVDAADKHDEYDDHNDRLDNLRRYVNDLDTAERNDDEHWAKHIRNHVINAARHLVDINPGDNGGNDDVFHVGDHYDGCGHDDDNPEFVYDLVRRDDIDNLHSAIYKWPDDRGDHLHRAACVLVDNAKHHRANNIDADLWAKRAAYIDVHAANYVAEHAAVYQPSPVLNAARALFAANRVDR